MYRRFSRCNLSAVVLHQHDTYSYTTVRWERDLWQHVILVGDTESCVSFQESCRD
jgi:hypothetical protein